MTYRGIELSDIEDLRQALVEDGYVLVERTISRRSEHKCSKVLKYDQGYYDLKFVINE